MIITSAIRLKDGQIFVGKNHSDAIEAAFSIIKDDDIKAALKGHEQGFLTSDLRFLDRFDAMDYAKEKGQLSLKNKEGGLTSDDLW
jgi:UDP-N-acetylmuramyl tripeptide synthase